MASIAPTRSPYQKQQVSPLARIGGLLLVLLVIAAGLAPIIPWTDSIASDSEAGSALLEPSSPKDTGPLSIFNGFDAHSSPAAGTAATDDVASAAVSAEATTP